MTTTTFNYAVDNYNFAPGKSEALLQLVKKVQSTSGLPGDVTDGVLRFLLHLTKGNITDPDPYPTELTPLNHPKFRKYASDKDRAGLYTGSSEEMIKNFRRHHERVNVLMTHPKSVFNLCKTTEDLTNRALYSHPGAKRTFFFYPDQSKDSGIGTSTLTPEVTEATEVSNIFHPAGRLNFSGINSDTTLNNRGLPSTWENRKNHSQERD